MVPKTWPWYATSPSIWSAKSPTSDQSSAAASAPPGTLNTCWTFSARCSQSRVNLDSLPCVWTGLGPGQRELRECPRRRIEATDLAAPALGEPDDAVGVDLQALRLALGRRI